MRIMGIESLAPKPGTSKRHPRHPVYPYLLRAMTIDRPNRVWATRKVLSWRPLDTHFCVEALKDALLKYGAPGIFNSDQGCQFTSVY